MNKTKRNKEKPSRQVITPESENWTRYATPALFGPVSRCVRLWRTLREQTPPRAVRADLDQFPRADEGRKEKQDKRGAAAIGDTPATSARSAGSLRGSQSDLISEEKKPV